MYYINQNYLNSSSATCEGLVEIMNDKYSMFDISLYTCKKIID